MKELLQLCLIILCMAMLGCQRSQKKSDNSSSTPAPSTEIISNNSTKSTTDEEPTNFAVDYLQSLAYAGGVFVPNENIWDIEEYKQYRRYYELTKNEERIIGAWIPIPKEDDFSLSKIAESFYFWPNKMCAVEYGPGFIIGLWRIDQENLSVTIYGVAYPSGGPMGYIRERCESYTTVLANIADISPIGYTTRKFAHVPIPDYIKKKFPQETLEDRAYHFKALFSFSGANGIEYGFMNTIRDIIEAGNIPAEDIVTLKEPRYAELW